MESTHPPQMNIHNDDIQKLGSSIAENIPTVLQIMGTYQMVLGSCLTMKKQQTAMNKSRRMYKIESAMFSSIFSLPTIRSPKIKRMTVKIIGATRAIAANPQVGMPERNDLFLFAFIWFDLASVNVSKKGRISKCAWHQGIREKVCFSLFILNIFFPCFNGRQIFFILFNIPLEVKIIHICCHWWKSNFGTSFINIVWVFQW